ncbi:MAG: hypothetical protein GWP59_02535 [Chlamydiales bacterium]|nr:hypothetical protein [Chlamydiales bacterium]NCF70559.1 hypothetical protein [Chlamydiales bacterium]
MSEHFVKLEKDPILKVEGKHPSFLEDKRQEVELFFKAYQKQNASASLFNGPVLITLDYQNEVWLCFISEYQFVLAQRELDLAFDKKFYSLAITGLGFYQDKLIVGKRSEQVYQDKGLYELVPAGAIDSSCVNENIVDYYQQFTTELWEESKIASSFIESLSTEGLIIDEAKGLIDLLVQFRVKSSYLPNQQNSNQEYSQLYYLTLKELNDLINKEMELFSSGFKLLHQKFLNLNAKCIES